MFGEEFSPRGAPYIARAPRSARCRGFELHFDAQEGACRHLRRPAQAEVALLVDVPEFLQLAERRGIQFGRLALALLW